jgi:hypothetical protein
MPAVYARTLGKHIRTITQGKLEKRGIEGTVAVGDGADTKFCPSATDGESLLKARKESMR